MILNYIKAQKIFAFWNLLSKSTKGSSQKKREIKLNLENMHERIQHLEILPFFESKKNRY